MEIELGEVNDWYRRTPWIAFGDGGLSRVAVFKKTDGLCAYCGEQEASTIDHMIPKSRGGSGKYKNLIGACLDCNNAKSDMTPDEFREAFFAGRGGQFYFERLR